MSPYEVRCPRCDVTFPIETKRCMHCGGPTGHLGQISVLESITAPDDAPFEIFPDPTSATPGPEEREGEADEGPMSVGRSLIRSLGGFVWIIVLIGFTLSRSCGGE
jgi:hypothetical protein